MGLFLSVLPESLRRAQGKSARAALLGAPRPAWSGPSRPAVSPAGPGWCSEKQPWKATASPEPLSTRSLCQKGGPPGPPAPRVRPGMVLSGTARALSLSEGGRGGSVLAERTWRRETCALVRCPPRPPMWSQRSVLLLRPVGRLLRAGDPQIYVRFQQVRVLAEGV